MYAVIKTGGKQYRVAEGDVIEVERLKVTEGTATFKPVLVVGDDGRTTIGAKALEPYTVTARVLGEAKGEKLTSFKYRNKTGYASKSGHRQLHTTIEIVSIGSGAGAPAGSAGEAASPAPAAIPEAASPAADAGEGGTEPAAGGAEAGTS